MLSIHRETKQFKYLSESTQLVSDNPSVCFTVTRLSTHYVRDPAKAAELPQNPKGEEARPEFGMGVGEMAQGVENPVCLRQKLPWQNNHPDFLRFF